MSLKKIMLLASMALATVAFAVPATASATNFEIVDHATGNTITSGTHVSLSGKAGFENTLLHIGVECEVHVTLEATSATTGDVTSFEITTETCEFKNAGTCIVTEDNTTGLPWTYHVASLTTLTITDVTIDATNSTEAGKTCALPEVELNFATVTATVNSSTEISSVTLSGTGTNKGLSVCAFGSLSVTGGAAKTWQIKSE